MKTVFPITYFGNREYIRALVNAEHVVFECKEHFEKGSFRSRCEILSPNGVQQLTIPVVRHNGSKTPMDEITISYDTDWRKKHWKSIETAYSSSPFFDYYGTEVEELIYQNEKNLVQFNLAIMRRMAKWLDLELTSTCSTHFVDDTGILDYRNRAFDTKDGGAFYQQVFHEDGSFEPNLSLLDLIFCEGPMARKWIID